MAITYKVKHYSEKLNETDFLRYLFQSKTSIIFHGDEMKPLDIVLDEMKDEIINAAQSAQSSHISAVKFSIPTTAWVTSTEHAGLDFQADIPITDITANHVAHIAFGLPSILSANNAGISASAETREGVLRIFAQSTPSSALSGECLYVLLSSANAAHITVPTTAWVESTTHTGYGYHADIGVSGLTANHIAHVAFDVPSAAVASGAGMPTSGETYDGIVRLFAVDMPNAAVSGQCLFIKIKEVT